MAKGKTPTVASQIKNARAPKGSALESLVRENQNFDLLAQEEMEDDHPYPLWLRVLWRKLNPDIVMPEENPGAGYPGFLSEIYTRMVINPDITWAKTLTDDDSQK